MFLLHSFLTVDLPGHPGLTNLDQLLSEFFFFKKKNSAQMLSSTPIPPKHLKRFNEEENFRERKKWQEDSFPSWLSTPSPPKSMTGPPH
jgi:hypothetical protein